MSHVPGEIHVHIDLPEYEAARYALRVLLAAAQTPPVFHKTMPSELPPEAVLLTYSRERVEPSRPRHLVLRASTTLWDHYGKEASLPPSPLPRIPLAALGASPSDRLEDPLVLPYVAEAGPPAIEVRDGSPPGPVGSIVTGADLIASAFFWISRYEESLIRERDEYGRVPQDLLRAVREGMTDRPLVDEYAELLIQWLTMLGSRVAFRRQPFRLFLTHDVDTGIGVRGIREHAENGLRTLYREAVRGRRPRTGLLGLVHWVTRGAGLRREPFHFADIVALNREFGFPSFFFLMANGTHVKDASYDILGDASRRVIGTIRREGGEIGLHVGLNAHQTPGQLRSEWERLRSADPSAWPAARSHFLAFFAPETWRRFIELGLRLDSTMGFSHHIGFRCGTSRAFRPFDVERREILPIWELPMTLMDVNLFHDPAPSDSQRISAVRKVAALVRSHGGCFVINWHNVSFLGHYRAVYRAILGGLRDAQPVRPDDLPSGDGSVVW